MTHTRKVAVLVLTLGLALAGCGGKEERVTQHLERGNEHLAAGDYEKARVEFKNVLQMEPKHVAGLVNMARVLEELNDPRAAAGFYQAALDADANHVEAKSRLARLLVLGGAVDPAAKLADELLAADPQQAGALAIRGAVKMKRGDKAGAEADARAALDRDPALLDATMLLVSILNNSNRSDEAAKLLELAAERHPSDVGVRLVLADVYQKQGRVDGAANWLREIIDLEPQQLSHRLRLARFYANAKRLDEAEAVLRDAVASDPAATEPKLALVEFMTRLRSVEAGGKELQQFVAANPDNAELSFGQARFHQAAGKADEAKQVYRALIERYRLEPNGLRARTELARQLAGEGASDQAQPLLAEVLRENPKDRDALMLRGTLALQREDAVGAIADFRAVLREDPAALATLKALARAHTLNDEAELAKDTYKKAIEVDAGDMDAHAELGALYLRTGQHAEALAELETAKRIEPRNVALLETLFKAYLASESWDKADEIIAEVRAAFPKTGAAEYFAGLQALAQKKLPEAEKALQAALVLNPDAAEVLGALVNLKASQDQRGAALDLLDQTLKRNPKHWVAHSLKGELLLGMGKEQAAKAAAQAETIIALNGKHVAGYRLLAAARLVQGDAAGAIAAYERGIAATDGAVALQLALASLHEQQQRHDEAIAVYERLLEQKPGLQTAANNLAMLLAAYRSDDISVKRAAELIEPLRATRNPAFLDTVGWVDYKRGQYAAAVPALEKALKTAPSSALVRYHLGMAHYKQGNHAAAKEQLQQALAGDARFYGRDEAESTLQALATM